MAQRVPDLMIKRDEVWRWLHQKGFEPQPNTAGDLIALLHSEVSEMLEEYRDHGLNEYTREDGKPEDVPAECADVLIRLLHFCAKHDIDLELHYRRKMDYNWTRKWRNGRGTMATPGSQ